MLDGLVGSHRHREFFESSDRARRRPDPFERFDAAIAQTQQRLHRERRSDQRARRTDATAATQVFESVDVEDGLCAPEGLGDRLHHRFDIGAGRPRRRQQPEPRTPCPCRPTASR